MSHLPFMMKNFIDALFWLVKVFVIVSLVSRSESFSFSPYFEQVWNVQTRIFTIFDRSRLLCRSHFEKFGRENYSRKTRKTQVQVWDVFDCSITEFTKADFRWCKFQNYRLFMDYDLLSIGIFLYYQCNI